MEYTRIIYKPGKVTQIIMNRPRYMNGLSHPMFAELDDAFARAADDKECKVIVYSGAGPCFSSGHDMMPTSPESDLMVDGRTFSQLVKDLGSEDAAKKYQLAEYTHFVGEVKLKKWRNIPKPTIAMVHGYCMYAAFGNAAVMDLIFASEDAMFLTNLGNYDGGVWWFGERKYKELLFEHRFITAREAFEMGFVSRIYPNREILEQETLAYANRVADTWPASHLRLVKESAHYSMDLQGFSAGVWATHLLHYDVEVQLPPQPDAMEKKGKGQANTPIAKEHLKLKQEADKKYYGK